MKGITLLMCVVSVVAAAISGFLFFRIEYDKGELQGNARAAQLQLAAAQQRAADHGADRDRLSAELSSAQRTLAELKARNTTLEARNSQLARELTQQRDQIVAREQSDQSVQQELANLRKQLADSRASLASSIGGATPEQVAAYEARILDLETQLTTLRRDLPPRSAGVDAPAGLSGEVIEVGPRSAFVVLNIGAKHGAVATLEMILRRGDTRLARIRLTDVRETYSVATVIPETGTGNIRPGDVAFRP